MIKVTLDVLILLAFGLVIYWAVKDYTKSKKIKHIVTIVFFVALAIERSYHIFNFIFSESHL